MTTGEKAERLMSEKGFRTQRALAQAAGVDETTCHNAIKAEKDIRVKTAIAIARALGVSADWLFDDEADWPPPGAGDSTAPAAPPFAIAPWPPHGITWVEVQQAISEFMVRRAQGAALSAAGPADARAMVEAASKAGDQVRPGSRRGKKRA